jgi:hypothetical protein
MGKSDTVVIVAFANHGWLIQPHREHEGRVG